MRCAPADDAAPARLAGRAQHRRFRVGLPGSPLGGVDQTCGRPVPERRTVEFQPGINEDLAATAVWGTQQVNLFPARVTTACSAWYGKGPGVDRCGDVFNANAAHLAGGVLVVAVTIIRPSPRCRTRAITS